MNRISKEVRIIVCMVGIIPVLFLLIFTVHQVKIWLLMSAISVLLYGSLIFFFRDPFRKIPSDRRMIVSPSDGRIVEIGDQNSSEVKKEEFGKVSIFLSLWNVHVIRSPVSGVVIARTQNKGRHCPAFLPEASENAGTALSIQVGNEQIVLRQIVGFIARRVICHVQVGEHLTAGQRIGIICFGSRVELLLPKTVPLHVGLGQKVRAGETVLGTIDNVE